MDSRKRTKPTILGATKVSEDCKRLMLHYVTPYTTAKEKRNRFWLLGFGHSFHPNGKPVKLGDRISREEAADLFYYSIQRAEKAVLSEVTRPLLQRELDALVSMIHVNYTFYYVNWDIGKPHMRVIISRINGDFWGDKTVSMKDLWLNSMIPKWARLNPYNHYRLKQQRLSEYHLFTTGKLVLLDKVMKSDVGSYIIEKVYDPKRNK